MYRILQTKINLVYLEWGYSIPFFTYKKLMQNLCWIKKKTIFSHFFISLTTFCRIIFHFFCFYCAEMRRKLWPKAPAKEGALGQMLTNFQVYFVRVNVFKKTNKKIYNRAKELYCDATIFVFRFVIVYSSKKNGNWKIVQGCRLSPTHFIKWKIIIF